MDHAVLIVDDEPKIYHALRRALHREPYDVVYAPGGAEALKLLGERSVDVIIADQNMPEMQGSVLLSRVRQQYPDIVRMMLTGDARLETVMAAVNKGEIYRFFTKPCNESELIISLRDALQMRALKFEAARLLDTVKKQNAQIQSLQATEEPQEKQLPAFDLKAIRGASEPKSEAKKGRYVIDMSREIPQDVDQLLDEIRSELEKLDL
ncbi:MAG TPA: response regulator [Planctomycetota bacterium]|nr:response regulator [Planctomycetota bacterium]